MSVGGAVNTGDVKRRGTRPRPDSPAGRVAALVTGLLLLVAAGLLVGLSGCAEEQGTAAEQPTFEEALVAAEQGKDDDTAASFISLCANCHDKLDPGPDDMTADWRLARKLKFDHAAHFAQGIRCQACHAEFPHKPGRIEHVPVETCFTCHGSVHGQQGEIAPTECGACHTKDIEPVTAEHDARDWVLAKGQKLAAHSEEVQHSPNRQLYCKMCHEATFCQDCHRVDIPHPAGFASGHQQAAKSEKKACLMCHETKRTCNDCHHQSFPALADWTGDHKQVAMKQGAESCFDCHEPPYCSSCHVSTSKKRGVLGG